MLTVRALAVSRLHAEHRQRKQVAQRPHHPPPLPHVQVRVCVCVCVCERERECVCVFVCCVNTSLKADLTTTRPSRMTIPHLSRISRFNSSGIYTAGQGRFASGVQIGSLDDMSKLHSICEAQVHSGFPARPPGGAPPHPRCQKIKMPTSL
jgi:hypothetical protein